MKPVKCLSQIGMAMVLLLLTVVSPAMTCMRPGVTLTRAEQACCKKMESMCAAKGMSVSHSCCQTITGGQNDSIALARSVSVLALNLGSSIAANSALALPVLSIEKHPSFVSPSPPQPSLSSLQVFRI